jgi:SAM-dependent methyltransferase
VTQPRPAPPPAEYDAFAWFYNRYWSEDFHSVAFPVLQRIWLAHTPRRARILDVCCGTGYLAGLLGERGYSVAGVDASAEMIRWARENVPAASFIVARADDFRLPCEFDAAVCTFDSLNHLLSAKELRGAFRRVAAALKPGAAFAFDMLLEEAYQTHWGEAFAIVRDDHVLTITGAAYDFRTRLAQCRITMFRLLSDAWRRADAVIHERCFTPGEIDAALDAAGFGETTCYDARDLGMGGDLGIGRTFYVARRK